MQRSMMWIATAALFASVLSGQGEAVGVTVPHGVNGPAGNGVAADRARSDVFELQCESNSSSN